MSGLNTDQGDGAGCWNEARTQAAEALVDWIDGGNAGNGDPDVILMGDLNSYAMEDPIMVFKDAGYADLSEGGYSYVFDGQWGYLDYALVSPSLQPQVTGVTEFHINSDEVPVLDYNTNYQSPWQVANLYAPDMYRTSDHDPVLLGLDLNSHVTVTTDPTIVAALEHEMVDVNVTATGADGSPWAVTILNAFSDQDDSGLAPGDLADDAVIVDADTASFRAEEYGGERTYVMYIEAVGPNGERVFRSLEVPVEVLAPPAPTCQVRYISTSVWKKGLVSTVLFRNITDEPVNGWTLEWDFNNGERITNLWRGDVTQTGSHVSVDNMRYNAKLWPNAWQMIGFVGRTSDGTSTPDEFTLNGETCEVVTSR